MNKKIYGVKMLNGSEYQTYTSPEKFKEIKDGWMKYWMEFISTDGYLYKVNPDLIVAIRCKSDEESKEMCANCGQNIEGVCFRHNHDVISANDLCKDWEKKEDSDD